MQLRRLIPLLAAFATCVLPAVLSGQSRPPALPGLLESYVTKVVKPTAAQRKEMFAGQPITQILDADPSQEVSVFGIVWVKAPVARYVTAIRDIEQFEKGENFRVTKKVSSPPRLDDFAQLTLPADDLEDLKSCRVGACDLKLSEASLNRIRKEIDWAKPTAKADVERLARRLMLDYINGYLEGGDSRLATYRDSDRPTFVGAEFKTMVDRMPSDRVSARPQELPAELSEGQPAEGGVLRLLAGSEIRPEADDPDQPSDHRRRTDARRGGLEDALCEPLLLDGHRAAGAGTRSGTGRRLLVRERQPQPLGRPQWIRRQADSRQSSRRGAKGDGGGALDHEDDAGTTLIYGHHWL